MKDKNFKLRLKIYTTILLTISLGLYGMTYMPMKSYEGEVQGLTVNQTKLVQEYNEKLKIMTKSPHNSTHIGQLKEIENYLENSIIKIVGENNKEKLFVQSYLDIQSKNFEVTLTPKGKSTKTVVIGAHYDSAFDSFGADDNASSIVILLELLKRFNQSYESKDTTLKIVFFANEEPPFFARNMGSMIYAKYLKDKKEPVIAMYAFDCLGYFKEEKNTQHYPMMFAPFYGNKGNFVAFVGDLQSRSLVTQTVKTFRSFAKFPSEGISAYGKIQGILYSDHLAFSQYEIPSVMVTDTAFNRNPNYHTTNDTISTLNIEKMAQLTDELEVLFREMYEK